MNSKETSIGYWIVMDSPISTERVAMAGFDYVCVDAQHGILDYGGIIHAIQAIDAGGASEAWVRVAENSLYAIGRMLDAGATGIIVPLINNAQDAARAVSAAKYPPLGQRSYGPMRSGLRVGPTPAEANAKIKIFAMIETGEGLENVAEIAQVPGLDGLYIGPSDLAISLGAPTPADPASQPALEEAIEHIRNTAQSSGKLAGIHTPQGDVARARVEQGFDVVTIASDVVHLQAIATQHLQQARG